MAALTPHEMRLLDAFLEREFVPHLPALSNPNERPEQLRLKNLSRSLAAFGAFILGAKDYKSAAKAVVDDYDDHGVDAILHLKRTKTVLILQAKRVEGDVSMDEILKLTEGLKILLGDDWSQLNRHFQRRKETLKEALLQCDHIQVALVSTGTGMSNQAKAAWKTEYSAISQGEERIYADISDLSSELIIESMFASEEFKPVDGMIFLMGSSKYEQPRKMYVGLAKVTDLASLAENAGLALYSKNVRNFLGATSDVSRSIRETLSTEPQMFHFYNNGITIIANKIDPKGMREGIRQFNVSGMSVVNGAQTVNSLLFFRQAHPDANLDEAKVLVNLIETGEGDEFGKVVTKARNHQNPVKPRDFAGLDARQERIRKSLAVIRVQYKYREGEDREMGAGWMRINLEETALALALTIKNYRVVMDLNGSKWSFSTPGYQNYERVFAEEYSPYQVHNLVLLWRYVKDKMSLHDRLSLYRERAKYRYGSFALAWVWFFRLKKWINTPRLLTMSEIRTGLGSEFDIIRQQLVDGVDAVTPTSVWADEEFEFGPRKLFSSLYYCRDLMLNVAIENYGLDEDTITKALVQANWYNENQQKVFDYLAHKAPQIPLPA